jgi:multisubunit Na+/H+ antiporter MnhG subunit
MVKKTLEEVMTVSNAMGIVIGILVVIIGFILLFSWWHSFAIVFEGIFPILLILIGAGVLIYFISESKSKAEIEKQEKTTLEQK